MTTPDKARSAADYLPAAPSLASMRVAVQGCKGCDLHEHATQAVFGEGPDDASIVLVGEQPGDVEDRRGRPFVGPAGAVLDRALSEVGLVRTDLYVTNAVKHFKWTPRGKRRMHSKPLPAETKACLPWLVAEIGVIGPRAVVALGATAAQTLFGRDFRVPLRRGEIFASSWAPMSMATVHPSSVLRAPDSEAREAAFAAFVADLAVLSRAMGQRP